MEHAKEMHKLTVIPRKIIIGDNVVQIGNDSFKSFGKRDKTSGSREIILGKHVTQIGENSFTEFGKGS